MKRITKMRPSGTRPFTPAVRLLGEIHHAQASIARLAGCSRQYVSAVVHGRKPPSARLRTAIAKFFLRRRRRLRRQGLALSVERDF